LIRPLTERASEWFWSALGPMLVAVGYMITLVSAWHPLAWILIAGGAIYAIGRSIQQPTIQSLVSKCSRADEQGVTFGLFQGTGTIARVIGPIVAGPLYAEHVAGPLGTAAALVAVSGIWTIVLSRAAKSAPKDQ
jgi:predicted MFS family arabinose efflux permease